MTGDPGALPAGLPREGLVAEVRARLAHLLADRRVVVACSGGPDSTALAFLADEARPDLELVLVHVRHGLRDDTLDRRLVVQHAGWLGAGYALRDVEVCSDGHGIEAAARDARYAALREVAAEQRATAILVGHTADDQAETLLLRLARGTGLDGLRGMATVTGDLVRPMLRVRRSDLRAFVASEGLPVVDDPSNDDPSVRRSVVRHEVLPALGRVAPDPVGALARLAELSRDDASALDDAAATLRHAVRTVGPVRLLPEDALGAARPSLARRVVRELLVEMTGSPPSAEVVARVLATAPDGGATLPGGVELSVGGGWRALAPRDLPTARARSLQIPGSTPWSPAGVAVRASSPAAESGDVDRADADRADADRADVDRAGAAGTEVEQLDLRLTVGWVPPRPRIAPRIVPPGGDPERLWMALPADPPPLRLRTRRGGDRIRTAGGTRRVADVLGDAGVPRPVRDLWPLVTSGRSVVWVPGYEADRDLLAAGRDAPAALLVLVPSDRRGSPGTASSH